MADSDGQDRSPVHVVAVVVVDRELQLDGPFCKSAAAVFVDQVVDGSSTHWAKPGPNNDIRGKH